MKLATRFDVGNEVWLVLKCTTLEGTRGYYARKIVIDEVNVKLAGTTSKIGNTNRVVIAESYFSSMFGTFLTTDAFATEQEAMAEISARNLVIASREKGSKK